MPFSNVKFISGYLDIFQMNALVEMKPCLWENEIYYHDMHIKLQRKGGTENKTLKSTESNLVNFFCKK